MTDKEAMAMALEALETLMIEHGSIYEKAIAALKEQLAQPQETTLKEFNQFIHDDPNYHIWLKKREAKVEGSLHVVCQCDKCKAPPPQRTEQEPVAWADHGVVNWIADKQFKHASLLYTTPPQRTWVELTDEDISEIVRGTHNTGSFVRAIEAKLKEKNT